MGKNQTKRIYEGGKRLVPVLLLLMIFGVSQSFAQGSLTTDEEGNTAKVHEQQKNPNKPWQFEVMGGTSIIRNFTTDNTYFQPEAVAYAKGRATIIGVGFQHQDWQDDFADITSVYGDYWYALGEECPYFHFQPKLRFYNLDGDNLATEYGFWSEGYWPIVHNLEVSGLYKVRHWDIDEGENISAHEIGGSLGAFVGAEWYLHGQLSAIFSEDAITDDWDTDWKPQVTARRYLVDNASDWVQLRAGVSDYSSYYNIFNGGFNEDDNDLTNNYFVLGTWRAVHTDHFGTQVITGYIKDQDYGHRWFNNVSLLFFF